MIWACFFLLHALEHSPPIFGDMERPVFVAIVSETVKITGSIWFKERIELIKDQRKYQKTREKEYWDVLRSMSDKESLSLAEALLTTELMDLACFPDDDHPVSLAISLGIKKGLEPGATCKG